MKLKSLVEDSDATAELPQLDIRVIAAQQEIERLSSDTETLQRLIKNALDQRKQRDQFIIKQAREIKRLRELMQ